MAEHEKLIVRSEEAKLEQWRTSKNARNSFPQGAENTRYYRYQAVLIQLAREALEFKNGKPQEVKALEPEKTLESAPAQEEKYSDLKKKIKDLQRELKEKNSVLEKYKFVSCGDEAPDFIGKEGGDVTNSSAAAEILSKWSSQSA